MGVEKAAKQIVEDDEPGTQSNSEKNFSNGSNKSMANGSSSVPATRKSGRFLHKIVSADSPSQRRSSPRLINMPEDKRPFYGSSPKKLLHPSEGKISEEKPIVNLSKQISSPNAGGEKAGERKNKGHTDHPVQNGLPNGSTKKAPKRENGSINSTTGDEKWLSGDSSLPSADGKSAHARVKETLKTFNKHYLHFVQEEENRCKKVDVDVEKNSKDLKRKRGSACDEDVKRSTKKPVSKKGGACEEDVKRSAKRPDLKAISKMLQTNAVLYPEKRFGHLPGVDVGHQFYSRAEMVALGFHSHWLNGIDYMGVSYSKQKEYKGHTFPLAVAIVLSGQYEDDKDESEDVVYTGQGGNDLLGNKRQVKNQEMSRGNLALKNSMEQSIPVRVIRGHESAKTFCKVYTYDGLYKVVQHWSEIGVSGFTVYKFRLRRLEGQPKLTTTQVKFSRGSALKVPCKVPGLVCEDISEGQEDIPIRAINTIDDEPVAPTGFVYSKSIQVAKNVIIPPNASGCNCKGNCTSTKACSCAHLNGADFPYVRRNGGRLVEPKDVVFECGPNCSCDSNCTNRTTQRGLKYQLEVFRTVNKGWAVRTKDYIPSGAPVCEYIGALRRSDELDNVAENDYIFEIDCLQTMNEIEGRERRLGGVSASASNHFEKFDDKSAESSPEFSIDAGSVGNVARFINHSCEPNLFVQCVLSTHHDPRLARVVLFAAESIAPMQELTYDYGYALDSVIDSEGKVCQLACHCGTGDCRKRLY